MQPGPALRFKSALVHPGLEPGLLACGLSAAIRHAKCESLLVHLQGSLLDEPALDLAFTEVDGKDVDTLAET